MLRASAFLIAFLIVLMFTIGFFIENDSEPQLSEVGSQASGVPEIPRETANTELTAQQPKTVSSNLEKKKSKSHRDEVKKTRKDSASNSIKILDGVEHLPYTIPLDNLNLRDAFKINDATNSLRVLDNIFPVKHQPPVDSDTQSNSQNESSAVTGNHQDQSAEIVSNQPNE